MAHFARLDEDANGKVFVGMVLVIPNEEIVDDNGNESDEVGSSYINQHLGIAGRWIQASYNGRIRGVYPGIGFEYDAQRDEFIMPGLVLIDGVWTVPPEPEA